MRKQISGTSQICLGAFRMVFLAIEPRAQGTQEEMLGEGGVMMLGLKRSTLHLLILDRIKLEKGNIEVPKKLYDDNLKLREVSVSIRYKRKERKKQWSLEVDPERDSEDWAGKVRDVRLIMESQFKRTFKRSWGISSFYDSIVSAFMAIALSWGQLLLGQPVMSEKKSCSVNYCFVTSGWTYRPLLTEGLEGCMLATCHFNINTKINLRSGDLNPFGRCGVGAAIAFMMKGGLCKKVFGFVQGFQLLLMIKLEHKMVGQNVGDCDDEEGGGLALNARSRALLIAVIRSLLALPKGTPAPYQQHDPWGPHPFCSSYTWTSSSGPSTSGHLTIPTMDDNWSPKPNQILIWTIKEDVQEGMLNGFGNVKHIYVDKNSAGFVYMRFENMQAAINAQRALHGRWLPPGPTRLSFLTADRS
ncbi:hypothetical protein NC652_010024 [Populus alba x Populus x berolinensis]|nr:hypothetical protein NC652_010024 [Populus alba x Populus x berolinensis]